MNEVVLLKEFWPFILISARLIGLFSWMPGFSDLHIPFRMRMMVAFGLALAFSATLHIPELPKNSTHLMVVFIAEYLTGTFLGFLLKVFLSALETAGTIMSQSIGLSNALTPNLIDHEQTSVLNSFFTMSGIAFIFLLDLHHLIIWGVYNSYDLIPIGTINIFQDKSIIMARSFSDAFMYALKFAMPFFIFGNLIYLGMGILNKLIPQIQVFFLSLPIQILVGLIIMAFSVGFILSTFSEYFNNSWTAILG